MENQEPKSKPEPAGQPSGEGLSSSALLADCERRAIELYYAAPPEKLAGDCRRELVDEFGESVVAQMPANGIGNNGSANSQDMTPDSQDYKP